MIHTHGDLLYNYRAACLDGSIEKFRCAIILGNVRRRIKGISYIQIARYVLGMRIGDLGSPVGTKIWDCISPNTIENGRRGVGRRSRDDLINKERCIHRNFATVDLCHRAGSILSNRLRAVHFSCAGPSSPVDVGFHYARRATVQRRLVFRHEAIATLNERNEDKDRPGDMHRK